MLGQQFYKLFNERMSNLMQSVNDYVETRTIEKDDLINTITSKNQQPAYDFMPPPNYSNDYNYYNVPRPEYYYQYPH